MLCNPFGVTGVRSALEHGRICALQAPLPAFPSKRAFRASTPPRLAYLAMTEVHCDAHTCQQVLQVDWRLNSRLRPRRASLGSEIARQNRYETSEMCLFLHAHTESSTKIHRAILENHQ